jgi:hypothetical protein
MSDRLPMPGAMPAEIAEKLGDVPAANDEPNFAETDDLADLVAQELREPLAQMFATRDRVRALQSSEAFGEVVNYRRATECFMDDIEDLEHALHRLWEQG